ncbi:MAG: GntR family transcriptional regulator [Anaerolineae bacterium]|nr:GntR family transcriptional regulator [Anaerolineae bacterium]
MMSMDKSIYKIDHTSIVPLYQQIKENLRETIESEALSPEDPLPSERELSRIYEVNRMTVRRAIGSLIQEGLLQHVEGIGVFLARPKVVQVFPTVVGFSERMRAGGHVTLNRVLSHSAEVARPSVARRLRIPEGAQVLRLVRLRIVDNEPLMIETSYVPLERFPDLLGDDFAVRSLYDVLSGRYGIHILELDQTLEPVLLTDYEAELLESTPGSPAMLMEVIALAAEDDPFEFSKAIVRGDKCQYYFRMRSPQ